jgi:AraC-like DNA-binding protein
MLKQKDGFHGERSLMMPKMIMEMVEQDPLVSMLHITDIGYYPHAEHHYRERREPIDQYVYIYCVDGAGWYQIGDKRYDVGENQYFILPAGVPHAYGADEDNPWTIYWIHFRGELAPYYAKDATGPMDVKPGLHSRIHNRIDLFEEIFNTLSSGFSNENLRYVSSLFHYYLGSLRYINQYREAGENNEDNENMVGATIHYMKENIEKHLTLKEISDYTGYSASYISMMFKQDTGHSPLAYLNLLKIQQACELLDTTKMKVNQICYKIGIDDAYYFSRLFSKTMGMSPKEYREMKKG